MNCSEERKAVETMPCPIESYIQEKHVEGVLKARLEELLPEERQALEPLLALGPSANTLQEILRIAAELAVRDSQALASVLSSASAPVISREGVGRKQKQKLIREALQDLRYPELKRLKENLELHQQKIRKDCGLKLQLPDDLEGDSLSVEVSARSSEELLKLSERFRELAEHPSTKAVFEILGGRSF